MVPIPSGVRVWIATGHTDMRRGMKAWLLRFRRACSAILMLAIFISSEAAAAIWSRFFGMMVWACRSMPNGWTRQVYLALGVGRRGIDLGGTDGLYAEASQRGQSVIHYLA